MDDYKLVADYICRRQLDFRICVAEEDIQLAGVFLSHPTPRSLRVAYNDGTDRYTRIMWSKAVLVCNQQVLSAESSFYFPFEIDYDYAGGFFGPRGDNLDPMRSSINQSFGDSLLQDFRDADVGPVCLYPHQNKLGFRSEANAIIGQVLLDDLKQALRGLNV